MDELFFYSFSDIREQCIAATIAVESPQDEALRDRGLATESVYAAQNKHFIASRILQIEVSRLSHN